MKEDQDIYYDLLKSKVKSGGFALLAEYHLNGVTNCAGLPGYRYSKEMLIKMPGSDFKMIDGFEHTFVTPYGADRPYVYALLNKD